MSKCEWDELGHSYLTPSVLIAGSARDRRENNLMSRAAIGGRANNQRSNLYCRVAKTWHDVDWWNGCYWREYDD